MVEDFMCVRYLDKYRRCEDGRWRFAQRVVTYDMRTQGPIEAKGPLPTDPGLAFFTSKLMARGKRTA